MKEFLDTNILMDFVDNRENREYAKQLFCLVMLLNLIVLWQLQ